MIDRLRSFLRSTTGVLRLEYPWDGPCHTVTVHAYKGDDGKLVLVSPRDVELAANEKWSLSAIALVVGEIDALPEIKIREMWL